MSYYFHILKPSVNYPPVRIDTHKVLTMGDFYSTEQGIEFKRKTTRSKLPWYGTYVKPTHMICMDQFHNLIDDARKWKHKNLRGRMWARQQSWNLTYFFFTSAEDAILFQLRWQPN